MSRYFGIDVGAETIKIVEFEGEEGNLRWTRREVRDHRKEPGRTLLSMLDGMPWETADGAAVTGRLGRQVTLPRIPSKQALAAGARFLFGSDPATIVSIGSRGFSVLELREGGIERFRENSRCAQGTGNFLRQLVERFDLTVEQAAEMALSVPDPSPLSGRCPVILKTDMTHLANKGESRERILAGLLDAIAENVQVLVKPRMCPPRLVLAGGVSRSGRVRAHFREFAARNGLTLEENGKGEEGLFLEALGAAVIASARGDRISALSGLILPPAKTKLETIDPLSASLSRVRRLPNFPPGKRDIPVDVIFGFDIGSTGSKAVALDIERKEPLWEGYLRTNGDPVGAARLLMEEFLRSPASIHRVRGFGATGSGREIVGSLLSTCYGREAVCVLNEIAAHARGALHVEPRVDTIFEIGGQDAKYIRLSEGRVVDAAMNEACSAGTGSFIEEQGRRFDGVESVAQLGEEALHSESGVALGQHCSIFMAEVIDEAVGAGIPRDRIIAGLYDSVVANYLNRVKGSRSVGQVIFCQGMPFASAALAAAVARQTGAEVTVPGKPGLMGAIGISLLAADELSASGMPAMDGHRFLGAVVEKKDRFVCTSLQGCGGSGNKCRIDRITTVVAGERQRFVWGGNCSLYDKGTRRKKLPDLAPDPFRDREALFEAILSELPARPGRPTVALTDEFSLKGLFPYFAHFINRLGFDLAVTSGAGFKELKRGIEEANVPFCAPMQQFHGLVANMADAKPDFLFLPMVRENPRVGSEPHSKVCPIAQAAPDMLRWDLGEAAPPILSPIVNVAGGLDSPAFLDSCRALAGALGIAADAAWKEAWRESRDAQDRFDAELAAIGRRALDFCAETGVTPVVVLGRSYTILNDVLNSNVPSILREQGTVAIPVDCLPVPEDAPVFDDVFWGHSQRILRAAWHVRRTTGLYSIFCSNYSCGPDSFTVHTYAWLMEGKPFAIIETDGHAGDAGTRTRVEAFLHCVREELGGGRRMPAPDASRLHIESQTIDAIVKRKERLLIHPMGPEAEAVAAAMRGLGVPTEVLPMPDADTLRQGRRHTSGKECLPMTLTLGSLLDRIRRDGTGERFLFLMPGSCGPCRFGAYRNLHHMILDRLGLGDRLRIWSPPLGDFFQGLPSGFSAIVFLGVAAWGFLQDALHDIRPVEREPGMAERIHARFTAELAALIEKAAAEELSASKLVWEVASGRGYGIPALLSRAARELANARSDRRIPSVLLVGEIYVRSDPFSNDFVARSLEARGIRVRLEPVSEFIQYMDHVSRANGEKSGGGDRIEAWVRRRFLHLLHAPFAEALGWPDHPSIPEVLAASAPYMREAIEVETVLTLGVPIRAWRKGEIDATVSVGPLECMPNKVSEAQFCHAAEKEGLLSLSLSMNGDPLDPEVLDNFAFEVHQRFDNPHRCP